MSLAIASQGLNNTFVFLRAFCSSQLPINFDQRLIFQITVTDGFTTTTLTCSGAIAEIILGMWSVSFSCFLFIFISFFILYYFLFYRSAIFCYCRS